jgi:hypothetical protein
MRRAGADFFKDRVAAAEGPVTLPGNPVRAMIVAAT